MKKLLTSLLLSCLIMIPLQAMEVRVLAWDKNISKRELAIAYGKKVMPIEEMHHFARTKPIKINKASKNLRIQAEDKLDGEGNPLFIPLEIADGIQNPLLLILPKKNDPIGIRALVIDDDVNNFAWGSIRFINITGEDLIFRHEKKNKLIPSGWKPSIVETKGRNRNLGISIYRKKDIKKDVKSGPVYSAIWAHKKNQRQLVFIMPSKDKSRGSIDFKFIAQDKSTVVDAAKKDAVGTSIGSSVDNG